MAEVLHVPATNRALRALAWAQAGVVKMEARNKWRVPSRSRRDVFHEVTSYRGGDMAERWRCTCEDHDAKGRVCQHIFAARFAEAIKRGVPLVKLEPEARRPRTYAKPLPAPLVGSGVVVCKWCASQAVVKNGSNRGKQQYACRACGRKFVSNDGFERTRASVNAVAAVVDFYFKGSSLRQVASTLADHFGVNVSHMTVYRWLGRYMRLLGDYAASLEPEVGDKWQADEVHTKFCGKQQYVWHVMDADTRLMLAAQTTRAKRDADAKRVLADARRWAGKVPREIVTDGLPAYIAAVKAKLPRAEHTREIHLSKPETYSENNRVERANGTFRARERIARGLKSPSGPLVRGFPVYYNFLRPHSALKGKTPAEAAGLATPRAVGEGRVAAMLRAALAWRRAIRLMPYARRAEVV